MRPWLWLAVGAGAAAALWLALVLALLLAGRRTLARELVTFVSDCFVLCKRLLRDPRVPRRAKIALALLAAYLALPFDLVPDFIPVAGQLDDALLAALVLRYLVRRASSEVVTELWPGSEHGLQLVLRAAGAREPAPGRTPP